MSVTVSVIVPAYNTRDYIVPALQSVLGQTLEDHEIIVIDDASSDGTSDAVRTINDPRIKLITCSTNGGAAVARNIGLRTARGEWIALLDSDDWYGRRRLEIMVQRASATKSDMYADDILFVRTGQTEPWSSLLRQSGQSFAAPFSIGPVKFVDSDIYGKPSLHLGLSKPLMRRQFLVGNNLAYDPNLRMGQDFWLYLNSLAKGARFTVDPEGHYYYRSRPGSLVKQSQVKRLELYCAAAAAFMARPADKRTAPINRALERSLIAIRRNLAYYRVVEPLKQGRVPRAVGLALRNPLFFRHALTRVLRAKIQATRTRRQVASVRAGA